MATKQSVRVQFGKRLPGRTKQGSQAYFRKGATQSARKDMADIIKRYEDFIRSMEDMTPDVLRNAMQPVFDKSQVYVPVDTGDLYRSGKLEVTRNPLQATITYGDASTWYAALVHEYVWLNHASPTRAKYLQSAMEEEIDSFLTSIAVDYAMLFR